MFLNKESRAPPRHFIHRLLSECDWVGWVSVYLNKEFWGPLRHFMQRLCVVGVRLVGWVPVFLDKEFWSPLRYFMHWLLLSDDGIP